LEIEPKPTSLNSLIETAITRHAELAHEQNLTLIHRPANPDPTALVDSKRLMQVLNNLVSNAIRYTPPEGTVTISTGMMKTEDRLWSTVVVSDTGIGIPEEELPHIFERFYRGEKPRAMQISGTGLGLAIVKEIVELHGGRVTVESEVDEGSSFTIWLPVAKRHQDTQAKTAPPTPARAS
jgi:two-component system sensor histidine kinase BaeS